MCLSFTRRSSILALRTRKNNMNTSKNVAYCGLYCGDCIIKEAKLGDLSQQLLNHMKTSAFGKLSKGLPIINDAVFGDLAKCDSIHPVLEAICNLDCNNICKEGGGGTACEIRRCCESKQLNGCWECNRMDKCEVLTSIEPVHTGANVRNMKKIRERGMREFLLGKKEW